MKTNKIILLLTVVFSISYIACSDDEPDPIVTCETTDLTYSNYAESFINQNCALSGCHVASASGAIGSLTNFEDVTNFVWLDRMISAINHTEGFSNMPKNKDKLDQCDIDKLTAWISNGLPE